MQSGTKVWKTDMDAAFLCIPGAIREADGVRFTTPVRPGVEASLLLYGKRGRRIVKEIIFPKEAALGNLRTLKVLGLPWEKYDYNYRIAGQVVCDPYARLFSWEKVSGAEPFQKSVMAFEEYDWRQDARPQIPYEDGVMYHLHVRNFTRQDKGIAHGGTFLGLQEKIPYLKALGVNQVKLMPVYEPVPFGSVGPRQPQAPRPRQRENCWGYGEGYYYAPRRLFAATPDPIREVKDMVHAFHAEGMEVLLEMYFVPGMAVRVMTDILTFWVREYHVDGFHIMGEEGIAPYLAGDPVLAGTKILVSGCSAWNVLQGKAESGESRMFAECNDGFMVDARRILKGDEGMLEAFAARARKNGARYGVVNYIANHDGFTLNDLVSYDNRHNEENGEHNQDGSSCNFSWNCGAEGPSRKKNIQQLRRRQMKNAMLLLLLSQGAPMLLAGDEFANSQGGNNNPWCLDNRTSWVDWAAAGKNQWLTQFVKEAIAFRKAHGILHMPEELKMSDYQSCGYPDLSYHSSRAWFGEFAYNSRQIGMMFCESYGGGEGVIYIAYNLNPMEQELALPMLPGNGRWRIVCDTSLAESFPGEPETLSGESRLLKVPARTIMILTGRKETK